MTTEQKPKAITNRDLLELLKNASNEFLNLPVTLYIGEIPNDEKDFKTEYFANICAAKENDTLYYSEELETSAYLSDFDEEYRDTLEVVRKPGDPVFEVINISEIEM